MVVLTHKQISYFSTTSYGPISRTPFTNKNCRQEKNCSWSCSLLPARGEEMNLILNRYCAMAIFTFIPTNCTILLLYSVHSYMFWLTSAIFRDNSFVLISPQRWLKLTHRRICYKIIKWYNVIILQLVGIKLRKMLKLSERQQVSVRCTQLCLQQGKGHFEE